MFNALPITFGSQEEEDEDQGVNKVFEAHHHEILFSLSTKEYAPLSSSKDIVIKRKAVEM